MRNELVVYDSEETCPYLPGRSARMPLRRPIDALTPEEFDQRLEAGDRRTGAFLYNTRCPSCHACQPIRLAAAEFQPSRTQRRVWRRGNQRLRRETGPAVIDSQRVAMFNRHRRLRNLATDRSDIDAFGYEHFLVQSCCETFELRYYLEDQLVAVAICDQGQDSMSAVYTFFEPEHDSLSLGVYSILSQIQRCRERGWRHLYLGYYIAESPHMRYKAAYLPHERRIGGVWQRFDRPSPDNSPQSSR